MIEGMSMDEAVFTSSGQCLGETLISAGRVLQAELGKVVDSESLDDSVCVVGLSDLHGLALTVVVNFTSVILGESFFVQLQASADVVHILENVARVSCFCTKLRDARTKAYKNT